MTTKTPIFEHVPCSRCCGTGKYSFNLMHGTRCYGCNGTGYKLTKRGFAAQKYLNELRSIKASEIQVGTVVLFDMFFYAAFAAATLVQPTHGGGVRIDGIRAKTGEPMSMEVGKDSVLRKGWSVEEKAEQRKLALAYQETLTKQGTPSKRKSAKFILDSH